MKKIIPFTFIVLLLAFFSSCEKRVCEENNTATLIITNQTIEPIQFYFDGVYLYDVIELTKETLEVTTGAHTFGAKVAGSTFLDSLNWEQYQAFSVCEQVEYTFE
jgi:surface polysaccharide O-acyltransferase-like enzyme